MTVSQEALGRIRAAHARARKDEEVRGIIEARDEVFARYSPMFQPGVIGTIDEDEFRSFLYFGNNKHWTGLHRLMNRICADMDAALAALGLVPEFRRGTPIGERYEAVNGVLRDIAAEVNVDLWTLDAIWWALDRETDNGHEPPGPVGPLPESRSQFVLERHLHLYLFENWDNLSLARDWEIFSDAGDPETGYEFSTPIGRIDLLARHRREKKWLVIELKRGKSSDEAAGQTLRYIGWVKAHLAEPGEEVRGLIVAHEGDPKLHYAVSAIQELSFMSYEVEFRLKEGPAFNGAGKPGVVTPHD